MSLSANLAMIPHVLVSTSGTLALPVRSRRDDKARVFPEPSAARILIRHNLGEKLLVQLGTANPGENAEERQKWNDGLRGVLKELRVKNIKDPNGIAVEIAKYRRQFLNDETRVVNLPHDG